jgi:tetratricopeptide (TPR) repeat protein
MTKTPPNHPSPWRSGFAATLMACLLVTLACLGIYGHGFSNELLFDDLRLLDGTVFDHYGSLLQWKQRLLSYGSFVWVADLFGTDNWAVQRGVNVWLHLLTAGFIGLLVRELLAVQSRTAALRPRLAHDDDDAPSPAEQAARRHAATLVAAGWFALHPVAVYATGYLIQRSILMATLFTALACWAFVHSLQAKAQAPRWQWAVLAGLGAMLAFLSKEHAVLVPLLAVPLYVFVKRPSLRQLLWVLLAAVAVVAVLAAMLWSRLGNLLGAASFDATSAAYVRQLDLLRPGAAEQVFGLSIFQQMGLFFRYLGFWLVPNVSAMSVDMRPAFPLGWTNPAQWAGALGFVAVLIASTWALWKRRDGWSLLALAVLCAMALFGTEFLTTWIQDPFVLYRSYLWALPLPVVLAWVLSRWSRPVIYTLGLLVGLVLAALAFERVGSFQSSFTLWDDAARKTNLQAPDSAFGRWRAFQNRGTFYLEHHNLDAALRDFDQAIALGEPLGSAQFSRGMTLSVQNRHALALQAFETARQQGFDGPDIDYQTGVSQRASGMLAEALTSFTSSLKADDTPANREHVWLAQAETALALRRFDLAGQSYRVLLEQAPDHGKYLVGLALSQSGQRDFANARQTFDKAIALRPDASAYYGRALMHQQQGQMAEAVRDVEQAVALAPQNALFRATQAQLLRSLPATVPAQP